MSKLTGKAPEHECYVFAKFRSSKSWNFIVFVKGIPPFMEGIVVMSFDDPFALKRRTANIINMGNLVYGPELEIPEVPMHLIET